MRLPSLRVPALRAVGMPSVVVRALALALVVAAPLLPPAHRQGRQRAVMIVVDRSASVGPAGEATAQALLDDAWGARRDARTGVVAFASSPEIVRAPGSNESAAPSLTEGVSARASGEGTDIASAVRLARAALPDAGERRIVLMTDGRATRGDALAEVRRAAAAGVVVDAVPIGAEGTDTTLTRVRAREEHLAEGEPAMLLADLHGKPGSTVEVTWTRDGEPFGQSIAQLATDGTGTASRQDGSPGAGLHVYGARIPGVIGVEGPERQAAVEVGGKPRALIVTLDSQIPAVLSRALDDAGIERVQSVLGDREVDAAALSGADLVVLADVPLAAGAGRSNAGGLSREAQEAIIEFAQRGGGVLVTGGPLGFAPEYEGTPLARMLPIEIESQGQAEDPRVAMAIMLDRSGSMAMHVGSHTKIQLAVEASLAAASTLRADDVLALGSVDTKTHWDHPLGPVSLLEGRRDAIRSTTAGGGGIYVFLALVDAYAALGRADAPVRHVILFADTADAEQQVEDCAEQACPAGPQTAGQIAETARKAGITTSVVGIGRESDSDTIFLRKLAASGGGRFYITSNGTDLRRIFVSETRVATRSNLRDGPVEITTREDHPILTGLDLGAFPPLGGYVDAKKRATADTAIETRAGGKPILASWRYGLGKVVALATDLREDWKGGWSTLPAAGQILRQSVRFAMRRRATGAADVRVAADDRRATVTVDMGDAPSEPRPSSVEVVAFGGSGKQITASAPLDRTAPGRFAASVATQGKPFVVARVRDATGARIGSALGHTSASDELAAFGPDERALHDLADAGGGFYAPTASQIMRRGGPRGLEPVLLWPWALVAAAAFVAVDLWLRRMGKRQTTSVTEFVSGASQPADAARPPEPVKRAA